MFLTRQNNLNDLVENLEPFEVDFHDNPRSLSYVAPPYNNIKIRLGEDIGDFDRYLFGANVDFEILNPGLSDTEWKDYEKLLWTVYSSTLNVNNYMQTTYQTFIGKISPSLLFYHSKAGKYKQEFSQEIFQLLSEIQDWEPKNFLEPSNLERVLRDCNSNQVYQVDPAKVLNRIRFIRNKVVHQDPFIENTYGLNNWGGVYLRYFEEFCTTLEFVTFP